MTNEQNLVSLTTRLERERKEIAKEYINSIGGFEKFAEWGLF